MAIDLTDDLASMGIAIPVTKENAGRKYHRELARQVNRFICCPFVLRHSWRGCTAP